MKLQEIGEFGLIKVIKDLADNGDGVMMGIGDDVAVLKSSSGKLLLVTTDILLQEVHFRLELTDPYHLGRKALGVNISDIASCGGTPRAFLTSLAVPPDKEVDFVQALYQGMMEMASECGVSLVGGDTSSGKELMLSITLLGEGEEGQIVYRHGAQTGDQIFVTGTLGDAALGLEMLKKGKREGKPVQRHLSPTPRIKEGREIAERRLATSMIDISDGLLADLGHIIEASGMGGEIWLPKLPLSEGYREVIEEYNSDPYLLALTGGEDYELLFTSTPGKGEEVRKLAGDLGTPITPIGEIVEASRGIKVYGEDTKEYSIKEMGHNHFRRTPHRD
ncbi:MAG: thiamine-phosphate kinase [Deltaproteobacteria bacterium]|nr:MAG: thiamine-phosphate kinase [Deltaproteobacteria bacterium]